MVVVSSRSSGGMIWSAISTTTTRTPRSCRFSAISRPMYPAPISHAVVIGAGYIGLEMAENLHERGVRVVVVEMADQIIPPLDRELTTTMESYIREHGVELQLGTQAAAFSQSPGGRP